MRKVEHGLALRAPWYVCQRRDIDRFAPLARRPAIQKYDGPDLVERIVADPRDSLVLSPADGDVWSYPVRLGPGAHGTGRRALATHAFVASSLRKLYQPNHDRFYAVVVEVFCDRPGLPRPGPDDDLELRMVLRRVDVTFTGPPMQLRRRAHEMATSLYRAQHDDDGPVRDDADVCGLLGAELGARELLDAQQAESLAELGAAAAEQAWMAGTSHAEWRAVGTTAGNGISDEEVELPMWRIPPAKDTCEAAALRSLWFGLVPTFSGDHESSGRPKLDDQAIYQVRCIARRRVEPGHEDCPREEFVSDPTEPFRLAAFADPEGTAKRRVSITMPDFRSVAARAGQPAGPGGVSITSPPRSQMSFDPNGGTPRDGSVGGVTAQTCTFALEIFMIVAMFVFSLFLPIVVFLFQLWWLLALRFCLPPQAKALATLSAFLATAGSTTAAMGAAEQAAADQVLGAKGAGAALKAKPPKLGSGADAGKDLVEALAPPNPGDVTAPIPESRPPDPLCGS